MYDFTLELIELTGNSFGDFVKKVHITAETNENSMNTINTFYKVLSKLTYKRSSLKCFEFNGMVWKLKF